jgi:hypothetical protein
MRQMVLDRVEFAASCMPRECSFQQTANVRARAAISDTAEHEIDGWPLRQKIYNLTQELGPIVLIERNMVHIRQPHTCLAQTIGDSLRRKSGPMLDAAEALFLCGCDELTVTHKCGRGISVEGI